MLEVKNNLKIDSKRDLIINDIYNRILSVRTYIYDTTVVPNFTREMRIHLIKKSIAHFEEIEEYEKCSKLMKILNKFNCIYFNTERYK